MAMPGGSQAPLCSAHHKQACVVMENQLLTVLHHVRHLLAIWADGMPKEHWALESAEQELGGSLVVRIEDDLVEIDTVALAALAHPSAAVRKEALAVAATTRRLYVARRQAYEMAVASKVELLQRKIASGKGGGRASQWRTSTGPDGRSRSPPKATGRGSMVANTTEALEAELAELKERQARAEPVEPFLLELIDECAVVVVRRAVKRELLDSAQGVGSELPNEAQFEKMQVPPLRKLLELPEQALFMSAQVTYTLAELVASAVACGCAKRTTKLRELLVAAIPRLPEPKKLSEFLAEGDMGTAVLWRNYHAMVFSLAAACKSTLPAPTPREPTQAAAAAAAAAAGVPPPLPLNAGDDDDDDDDAVDLDASSTLARTMTFAPPTLPTTPREPPKLPGIAAGGAAPPLLSGASLSGAGPPPLLSGMLRPAPPMLGGGAAAAAKGPPPLLGGGAPPTIVAPPPIPGLGGISEDGAPPTIVAPPPIPSFESSGQVFSAELGAAPPPFPGGPPPIPTVPPAAPGAKFIAGFEKGWGSFSAPPGGPIPGMGGAPPAVVAPPPLPGAAPPPLLGGASAGAKPPPPLLAGFVPVGGAPPPADAPPSPPPSPPPATRERGASGANLSLAGRDPVPKPSPRTPRDRSTTLEKLKNALTPGSTPRQQSLRSMALGTPRGGGGAALEDKQHEMLLLEACAAIKPCADKMWAGLLLDQWVSTAVTTVASCFHPEGSLTAVESLCLWYGGGSKKAQAAMRFPMVRALRSVAQADGFRDAVLADAEKSEHHRLLQLSIGFVREVMPALEAPHKKTEADHAFCLELVLLVCHLARATTSAVRYDGAKWLKPLYVPDSLRNAWPLNEKQRVLALLKEWCSWRENLAFLEAEAMATGKKAPVVAKPAVGSAAEKTLYRLEMVAAQAIWYLVKAAPVMDQVQVARMLDDGPWGAELHAELAWFEQATDSKVVLRNLLGHHFPALVTPFLQRAYFYGEAVPALGVTYFHATVDAFIPEDGEAICEERHRYDDETFAGEVKLVAPQLMLFALFHLKASDARIRGRAFDLICRLTATFGAADDGKPFACRGPLGGWRNVYSSAVPSPTLLASHTAQVVALAPQFCASLSAGVVGETLTLLLQDQPSLQPVQTKHLLQVAAPWFANLQLQQLPEEEPASHATFVFLRRIAIVAIAGDLRPEAMAALLEAWENLAAAGVGVKAAHAKPAVAHPDEETVPPNVPIMLEWVLQVAGRSEESLALCRRLVLVLFDIAPHEVLQGLLNQISRGRLKPPKERLGSLRAPEKKGFLESMGDAISQGIRRLSRGGGSAGADAAAAARRPSALGLVAEATVTRVVMVTVYRGADGALGLGLDDYNCVSELHEGKAAALHGGIEVGDRIVAVNGVAVSEETGGKVGPLIPKGIDEAIELKMEREVPAVDGPPEGLEEASVREEEGEEAPAAPAAPLSNVDNAAAGGAAAGLPTTAASGGAEAAASPRRGAQSGGRASSGELRASALQLILAPVRQSMCTRRGQLALKAGLPVLLNVLLVLFESQTASKLSHEENVALRSLMLAVIEATREARRTALGLSAAPFSELNETLPPKMLRLVHGLKTKGFKLRWPRLISELMTTTPDVKAAFEAVNFIPVADAINGLLESCEDYAHIPVASGWAAVCLGWLGSTSDTTIRFKALALLRLLLPRLPEAALDDAMTGTLLRVLSAALDELNAEIAGTENPEAAKDRLLAAALEAATMGGSAGEAAAEAARTSLESREAAMEKGKAVRKPLPLALAEEALSVLRDVVERLAAEGTLADKPGPLWACVGLTSCPYATLQTELYAILALGFNDERVHAALSGGKLPPPAPREGATQDAFAEGSSRMLIKGLRAVRWWRSEGEGDERRHLLPPKSAPSALHALRCMGSSQANFQVMINEVANDGGKASPGMCAALLDCFVVQLPAMHEASRGVVAGAASEAALIGFEELLGVAHAIDSLLRDEEGVADALEGFLDGAHNDDPDGLVAAIGTPVLEAFLPAEAGRVADLIESLLIDGPAAYATPLFLLAAAALRLPAAPQYVGTFHKVVQLAVDRGTPQCTDVLVAAMQASASAGDAISSRNMATGQPFELAAHTKATKADDDLSMLALKQVVDAYA